jgi:ferritin-like metal-binding protein YciE
MAKSTTPARDAVLVKYLNEAYGKEKQLETALAAQIGLAQRPQLKKGLQDHLKVTKAQAKGLAKRIRELGSKAEAGPDLPGPDVVTEAAAAATNLANKAIAGAKGPVQALRGTSDADNELRNVRDCLWNEAEEIAHYNVIEAAAVALGDKETAKLAQTYRREEEKMQKLLERQITPLIKAVIKDEVPASERTPARRAPARRTAAKPAARRSAAARSRSAQKAASTRTRKAAATSAKSTATSAATTARKAGSAARSTAKRAVK